MSEFSTKYRGYQITNSKYFTGLYVITRPSGKTLTLTSKLGYALSYIDQDIKSLLAV